MFSVVPGISPNMTFMHNPPSKPSNRYVKSSTNPNVTYVANPNLYDLGYVSILPAEGIPPNWFPNSSYSPSYGQDYAIYSTPTPNPFDYDHSAPFLDFEDVSSITTDSTTSPALSIDSLETLKSPVDNDELDTPHSENRVIPSTFPHTLPQVTPVGRTLSSHLVAGDHMISGQQYPTNATPFHPVTRDLPRTLHPPFSSDYVEDNHSTISELEVEERDRIAKINAEYNATSHVGFYRNNIPSQAPKYPAERFRESNTTSQLSSMQARSCLRLTVSQPRHPDLHFPQRPIGNEKKDSSSSPYQIYANPVLSLSSDASPPSVERLPSQPLEKHDHTTKSFAQSQSSSPAGSPSMSPAVPVRKHRSSVLIPSGHSSQSPVVDVQESLQGKQQSRSEAASWAQLSTIPQNQPSPYGNFPESPQILDSFQSSPDAHISKATETERIAIGSNFRKDTKTPGPSGRDHSYNRASHDSSSSSQDVHGDPDMREKFHKSSPKADDKSEHGRSPSDSSSVSSKEQTSSFSQSNLSLLHEPVLRHRMKETEDDGTEPERTRRLHSSGTERAAISMYTQSPVHLSEGVLSASPQSDSQVVLVETVSDRRHVDPHNSKAIYDQASLPNSRESHKVREHRYLNSVGPQSGIARREGYDSHVSSGLAVLQSSPSTISVATSNSPPSKLSLESPPTFPPEPHRRHSDGDQVGPPIRPPLSGRNSAPLVRSVRWTENLIAPSPILVPRRKKGWFNRRGDQLWTNSGNYRPPHPGEEYPLDLDDYPEPGDGWMNEDGVRIDMTHRRIPKALPRPVLKK